VRTLAVTFDADLPDTRWTTAAYLLAPAAVIPATGWTAQRFGATSGPAFTVAPFIGSTSTGAPPYHPIRLIRLI
jgi:hypothetical protein